MTTFCIKLCGGFLPHEATHSMVLPGQVVCPSVCPSVTLRYRDHIGWNSAKTISWLISQTILLSADPNITDLLQSEHPPNFSRNRSGVGKIVDFRHLSRRISRLKRWKMGSKLRLTTNSNMYTRFRLISKPMTRMTFERDSRSLIP